MSARKRGPHGAPVSFRGERREIQLELGHPAFPRAGRHGTFLHYLLVGLEWSIVTALCAWVIALVVGSIVGTLRTTTNPWVVRLGNAYVEIFRNIPLIVQMFLWFFVFPELLPKGLGDAIKQMPPPWSAFIPAVLCLGFFTSVRVAEQVRAGIKSLPRGQRMAGTAMGLNQTQTYVHVILPQAFRIILPPLTSEFMNVIKNSSVALTIGLMELTGRARAMQEFTLPGVRGLRRGDGALPHHQPDRRAGHAHAREEGARAGLHRRGGPAQAAGH